MLVALIALQLAAEPPARSCSSEETAALLAPGSHDDPPVRLTCRARLGPGDQVTRRVLIEGAEASGAGLICDGAVIGRAGQPTTTRAPTIAIWSRRDGQAWSRPRNILIQGCHVNGAIRVWGVGAGQQMDELRQSSYRADHTRRLQAAAPTTVRLEDVTITGTGSIPLYVGPGVTGLSLTGSRLDGRSVSTAIYLDAESGLNVVSDNTIAVRTAREVIAVDGSAGNVITGNTIALSEGGLTNRGGVFLYRNCGEDGIVRHQTPSNNRITGNTFHASWFGPARAVVVGSREGDRRYCDADAGHPFGSSQDDGDGAAGNVVGDNRVERGL